MTWRSVMTTRADAFDSPCHTDRPSMARGSATHGRALGESTGPMGTRHAAACSHQDPFAKLDLERQLVANATSLVVIDPSFEAEINALTLYCRPIAERDCGVSDGPVPGGLGRWTTASDA